VIVAEPTDRPLPVRSGVVGPKTAIGSIAASDPGQPPLYLPWVADDAEGHAVLTERRRSLLAQRETRPYEHPIDWAAFAYSGV